MKYYQYLKSNACRRFHPLATWKSISVLLLLVLTGCEKFLDVKPASNITIASSASDYRNMLYPFYLTYTADPIIALMGDDVYWSKAFYQQQAADEPSRRAYLWRDEIYDVTMSTTQWNNQYGMIYVYNKIIDEVLQVKGEPASSLQAIAGEARTYRAFNYFHLVSLYAAPYSAASAAQPGIPLVEKNNVEEKDRRRTPIGEVYAYILNDLDTAIKYLPLYPSNPSRHQASGLGAMGLKARVLFNMGAYTKALEVIELFFQQLNSTASPLGYKFSLFDYNKANPMPWDPAGIPSIYDVPGNVEAVMTNGYMFDPTQGYAYGHMNATLVSEHLHRLFQPGDKRAALLMTTENADPEEPSRLLKTGGYSNTGVSMPDMYLMAAECYIRSNNPGKALEILNTFRKNRMDAGSYQPLPSAANEQVLKWVLEERMREFIATGHRWFDMRRLWNDPVGGQLINKTRMLDGAVYTITPARLTVRIPGYIMQYHKDWIQN